MTESLTEVLRDLDAKRAYVAERLKSEQLPNRDQAADAVREEIAALGLDRHVVALETSGYTVLTPEELEAGDLVERMNKAIDRVGTQRNPKDTDLQDELDGVLFHLVAEDPVFEEVLLQRKPLALLTYLLGHHAKLNQSTALLKSKGAPALAIHADAVGKFPLPWPETAQVANVTWLLSDYTREGGCLCVVPGTHRMGNPPHHVPLECDDPSVVPIEAPAGSVVLWHGGLWHGGLPRTIDGERRTLVLFYGRAYLEAQEPYKFTTTMEMLERNPVRFAAMMGLTDQIPWGLRGPVAGVAAPVSGIDPFE
jgi:hypothetical protein